MFDILHSEINSAKRLVRVISAHVCLALDRFTFGTRADANGSGTNLEMKLKFLALDGFLPQLY